MKSATDTGAASDSAGVPSASVGCSSAAADAAPGEVTAAVGHPDDDQHEHQRRKPLDRIDTQQHRGDLGRCRIAKARRSPPSPLRRRPQDGDQAEREHDQRGIDPPGRKAYPSQDQRNAASDNQGQCAGEADDGQPFHVQADGSRRNQGNPQPATDIGDRDRQRDQHGGDRNTHQEIARI